MYDSVEDGTEGGGSRRCGRVREEAIGVSQSASVSRRSAQKPLGQSRTEADSDSSARACNDFTLHDSLSTLSSG